MQQRRRYGTPLAAVLLLAAGADAFSPALPAVGRGGARRVGVFFPGGQIPLRLGASVPLRRAGGALTAATRMSAERDAAAPLLKAAGMSAEAAAALIDAGKIIKAEKGGKLVDEAKDGVAKRRTLFLVVDGEVTLTRGGNSLTVLGRGEFVGESRFLEFETLQTLQELRDSPLQDAFSRFDDDKSGGIDSAELVKTAKSIGIDLSLQQAQQFINKVDKNSDGQVSLAEARQAVESLKKSTKSLFKQADVDKSGLINAQEIQKFMEEEGIKIEIEQARKLMAFVGGSVDNISLTTAMDTISKMQKDSKLQTKFAEYDRDGNGRIDVNEMAELLSEFGIALSFQQISLLFEAVDMNNDGLVDFREFDLALDSVKNNIVARFGDAMRLFETVAFKTQRRSQVTAIANVDTTYILWDFDDLITFFQQSPEAATVLRRQWALQLTNRLRDASDKLGQSGGDVDPGSYGQAISAQDYSVDKVTPGNYGWGGAFTYGVAGDYGPLDKAVPANFIASGTWNFGREYRALRKFFRYEEFKEFVDAVSGAGEWERAREGLEKLVGSDLDEQSRRDKFAEAFRSMDTDGSGILSIQELQEALESLGITTSEDGARKMIKAADSDSDEGVSESEFVQMIEAVLSKQARMQAAFSKRKGWFPSFLAQPLLWAVEQLGKLDKQTDEVVDSKLRPIPDSDQVSAETQRLRNMLGLLQLDNDAIWKREELRKELLEESFTQAQIETSSDSAADPRFVDSLATARTPAIVMGPYFFLCWILDVLFINRPIQRFWFLETVARMPYFSYITMLTLYETLGWWRASSDVRRIHFAEEWNEVQHLKIMEALGGDSSWLDRFLARHAAIFYYIILNHVWLISPSLAYNFSELIEFHAVDTYGEFVDVNEALLKQMPAPKEAIEYYGGEDLFLFDEFQTGREPASRRPLVRNLYDVFCNIRDDELEHVKTMFQCQTAESQIISPNTRKATEEARARK